MDNKINYQIIIDLKDRISGTLKNVKKQFDEIDKAAEKVRSTSARVQNVCEKLAGLNLVNFVTMLDRSSSAFRSLSEGGATFEQSMADLSSITGIVGKELDGLSEVARRTGKESGLGASGAANAFALLASQIQVDKIGMEGLKVLQKETITLAQAAGMGMSDAATAMAATINQFGLEATEANRVINVLAAGSKYGAAEITELAQSFKVTGATAASAGLSVEQTAGALEVLSKMNLKGAEAGTALRNILLKMQTDLKVDFSQTGLSTALDALKPKLNDVTFLAKLFGAENISAAQFLITNAAAVDEMTRAVTGTNVAQEQAAIRTGTAAEQMKRLQSSVDDVKISIFNATGALAPYLQITGEMLPAIASMISVFGVCSQTVAFFTKNNLLAKAALLGKMAAEKASIAVTYAVTAAQAALNAVMSANPVALVVLAIAGLIAGLIAAYHRCETFRNIVDRVWAVIKKLASVVWDKLVAAFNLLGKAIGFVWGKLKQLLGISDDTSQAETQVAEATENVGKAADSAGSSVNKLTLGFGELGKQTLTNLATLGGIENKLSALKAKQKEVSTEQAIVLEKEIRLWEEKKNAMERSMVAGVAGNLAKGGMPALQAPGLPKMDTGDGIRIPIQFDTNALERSWRIARQQFSDSIKEIEITGQQIGSILTNSIQEFASGLGEAITSGNGAELLKSSLLSLMGMLEQFGSALIAAGTASLALKSVFANPIAGIIAGAALITAVSAAKAALQNATAFAAGGIVSGPTLALVGEYSGASNNPEVIAPLNKLKSMIEPTYPSHERLQLETKIKGKDLYVALRSVEHTNNRTR